MIGKKVRVFWPVDGSWYIGTVQQHDPSSGEHLLQYDDEDTEWVKIGESNTTAPPTSTPPGPTSPPGRASSNEGSLLEPIPPVSPSGQMMDTENVPSHHAPYHTDGQPSVTPDHRDVSSPRRGGPPPAPHHGYHAPYGGSPGGVYPPPPMGYHGYPPYPHGPPGPYGYAPPGMFSPHHSPDGKDLRSPSPSIDGKRKQGPKAWTKEEDALLLNIVQSMRVPMKWSIVAQSLPERTGKQCRERYVNHLNPRLKVSDWSPLEDATIFHLYDTIGSHWAKMSKMIPGRTDNGIKNRFHNLRRQLEREDEHRLRLSTARDFPEEIRLDRMREVPEELRGKSAELWDMKSGLSILAAQSVIGGLGGGLSRNAGRFGPFRLATDGESCIRCGFFVPSVHTGKELCTKTGWCESCTRLPPHVGGNLLRECLNLRRCLDAEKRKLVESWEERGIEKSTGEKSVEA
jgi:hypothetical protein